ncbi:hypothetical protein CXB51_031012 [Gossypium anomalum]|uniref:Rab-GAP TBC domain-containing protein n=1 Tax=Gossypium anomalum TaxID=47600 RepID=A0A8J5YFG5_9ROSI|nr:hypothetical protein CXB51_031012 [Gossypium anomalum]
MNFSEVLCSLWHFSSIWLCASSFPFLQGMSDLLSPILFVMKDESESFWCFVALIECLGPNFNHTHSHTQTCLSDGFIMLVELLDRPLHKYFKQNDCLNCFFCFRWILIQFKRLKLYAYQCPIDIPCRYFWLTWSSLVLTLKACWLNRMNKFAVLRDFNFVAKNLGVEFFEGTVVLLREYCYRALGFGGQSN